jgi:hypothetical protein
MGLTRRLAHVVILFFIALASCGRQSGEGVVHSPSVQLDSIDSPSSKELSEIKRGVAMVKTFVPKEGLLEMKKGAAYQVEETVSEVFGELQFTSSEDFSNTHVQAVLNLNPYPAFPVSDGEYDHFDFSPLGKREYHIPLRVQVTDLDPGTNCLFVFMTEDPRRRIEAQEQNVITGLRIDLIVGEPSPDGCERYASDNPQFSSEVGDRTVGSLEVPTSVSDREVRLAGRVSHSRLPAGRLFTRISGAGERIGALFLLYDGKIATDPDGRLLVQRVDIPSRPQELRVSALAPKPLANGSATAFILVPGINHSLTDTEPGTEQPKGLNQVLVTP